VALSDVLYAAALIVMFAALGTYLYRREQRAFKRVAASLGLEFSTRGQADDAQLPFDLFRSGYGLTTSNRVSGSLHGVAVAAFHVDFSMKVPDALRIAERTSSRSFLCAVTKIAADCPPLEIARRNVTDPITDSVRRDSVLFESDRFDRTYHVRCGDRRFASALIDPAMIAWLLDASDKIILQTAGPYLLAAWEDAGPDKLRQLLQAVLDFRAHVPALVQSEYAAAR
jgi:hypothetical protein